MRTTPLQKAIRTVERRFYANDQARHREDMLAEVRRLSRAGVTHSTIAQLMGMSDRNVERILADEVADVKSAPMLEFDTSREHGEKLERTVESTVELAMRLRDEDPSMVYEVGRMLDRHTLIETWMVALAAMPIDRPRSEIFGWVEQLGEQR